MTALRAGVLFVAFGLLAACGREPQPVAVEVEPAPVAPAPAPVPPVTEAQVREVAEAAEKAASRFDTHDLRLSLADDVRFTATPPSGFGPTLKVEGRDRVIAQIDSNLSLVQKPAYTSRGGELRMAADGTRGTLEFAAVTRYEADRHAVVEESTDVYTVAMRDGVPKVVEMTQTTTGVTIDGDKRF